MRGDSPVFAFGAGFTIDPGRPTFNVASPVGPASPGPEPTEVPGPDIDRWESDGGSIR